MLTYATVTDLAAAPWSLNVDEKADRMIVAASQLVRAHTRAKLYDVDTTGAPTKPTVIAGFKDAVCAQVATWIAAGIDPTSEGLALTGRVTATKALGGASVGYAGAEATAAARARAARHLCVQAVQILAELALGDGMWVDG